MKLCEKCGSSRVTLVKQEQHLQVFRCDGCGELIYSRMYPAEKLVRLERVQVFFTWRSMMATAGDAMLVRKLCPAANDISIRDLLQKLQTDAIWDAGIFPCHQAADLSKRAEEMGLKVEIKEIQK